MKKSLFLSLTVLAVLFNGCSSSGAPADDGDTLPIGDREENAHGDEGLFNDAGDEPMTQDSDVTSDDDAASAADDDFVTPPTCGNNFTDEGEICDGDAKECAEIDSGYTGGMAVCREDCSGYDTSMCIGEPDGDEVPDADEPAGDSLPDADTMPSVECVYDTDCGSATRICYKGICRDKCTPYINPCDWKPSGNVCTIGGYCVECQKDSDCPGTRYTCDTDKLICVDKPFDPNKTKIGVFYHTWHCPSAAEPHDISKILAGQESWPAWPTNPFPPTSFWWGEPNDGYYCLTNNTALLAKHAEMLRDMGADFVFVDVTNHPYNTGTLCDRPEEMILQPFATLVEVWSTVPGAPRIVPWVPVTTAYSSDKNKYMVYSLLTMLNAHPGLQFVYQGKPLVIITENDQWPVDAATEAELAVNYTVRRMWAFEPAGTAKWSYLERCPASPLESEPCFVRISQYNGAPEQLPIGLAYGADYMSHTNTATPKHHGKTFRKQVQNLFDNPEIPIALITGWNEWVVGRQPCDKVPLCPCSDPQNANGCFLDQYTTEYNRDIEPNKNEGDFYYNLVSACIKLFRAGGRCNAAHANDPCCKE